MWGVGYWPGGLVIAKVACGKGGPSSPFDVTNALGQVLLTSVLLTLINSVSMSLRVGFSSLFGHQVKTTVGLLDWLWGGLDLPTEAHRRLFSIRGFLLWSLIDWVISWLVSGFVGYICNWVIPAWIMSVVFGSMLLVVPSIVYLLLKTPGNVFHSTNAWVRFAAKLLLGFGKWALLTFALVVISTISYKQIGAAVFVLCILAHQALSIIGGPWKFRRFSSK